MASLFKSGCVEAHQSVFSDEAPETWCWLGYEGNSLVPVGSGTGTVNDMIAKCEDNNILYGFLRLNKTDDGGDSKRVKFVFITWVGESASPLKKGKVALHKKEAAGLFKGYHIEKQIYERDELAGLEKEIDDMLKKAGGANYDLGNQRMGVQAGNSDSYKMASKKFFQQKEAEGEIKNIVYNKGPLTKGLTACDLGGRQFVASHSDAKRNIVGYQSPAKSHPMP
eukprot:TRINITY_DN9579_c0_g1_i1.p1 TRINITY_DN9579_c0_g1~~TRINITY_DN9579_c0_g1_i1.p1  ORF type:complete len:224 (+),score=24.22 TRINITY_DN9579_c0_g1_i1:439-1110(+)